MTIILLDEMNLVEILFMPCKRDEQKFPFYILASLFVLLLLKTEVVFVK